MAITIIIFKQPTKREGEACLSLPFSLKFGMFEPGSPDGIGHCSVGP